MLSTTHFSYSLMICCQRLQLTQSAHSRKAAVKLTSCNTTCPPKLSKRRWPLGHGSAHLSCLISKKQYESWSQRCLILAMSRQSRIELVTRPVVVTRTHHKLFITFTIIHVSHLNTTILSIHSPASPLQLLFQFESWTADAP